MNRESLTSSCRRARVSSRSEVSDSSLPCRTFSKSKLPSHKRLERFQVYERLSFLQKSSRFFSRQKSEVRPSSRPSTAFTKSKLRSTQTFRMIRSWFKIVHPSEEHAFFLRQRSEVKRFSYWWRAVVSLTSASRFNIEPNGVIFDVSRENDRALPNVKTPSAKAHYHVHRSQNPRFPPHKCL